jgi:hypothetical protein
MVGVPLFLGGNMKLWKIAHRRHQRLLKIANAEELLERPNKVYYDIEEFMEDFGYSLRDSIAYRAAAHGMRIHNEHVLQQERIGTSGDDESRPESLDSPPPDGAQPENTPLEDFDF